MLLLLFDLTDYNLKKSPFPQTVQKIPVFDPNNLFFPSPWKYLSLHGEPASHVWLTKGRTQEYFSSLPQYSDFYFWFCICAA